MTAVKIHNPSPSQSSHEQTNTISPVKKTIGKRRHTISIQSP